MNKPYMTKRHLVLEILSYVLLLVCFIIAIVGMATLPDETEEVRYPVTKVDSKTNLLTFRAPYADGTVYAEFAPLADGEKSSAVQVKSFAIAGVQGVIDESYGDYIRVTGLPKSVDLSQVEPEVTLSEGAQAQAEPLEALAYDCGSCADPACPSCRQA